MPTGFENIIAFLRRTGDRCVVVDERGNPSFVVLPMEEYEELLSLPPAFGSSGASPRTRVSPSPVPGSLPVVEAAAGAALPTLEPMPAEPGEPADQYYFEPIE